MAADEKLKMVSTLLRVVPPLLLLVVRFSAGSILIVDAVGVDGAGESKYDG